MYVNAHRNVHTLQKSKPCYSQIKTAVDIISTTEANGMLLSGKISQTNEITV